MHTAQSEVHQGKKRKTGGKKKKDDQLSSHLLCLFREIHYLVLFVQ